MPSETWTSFALPIGTAVAGARHGSLSYLSVFGDSRDADEWRTCHLAGASQDRDSALFAECVSQLERYFRKEQRSFDLPLSPTGTPFQQEVWKTLTAIPCGQTVTYEELARSLGRPGGSRAVGQANHHNPIGIIIPCHRVIGADGSLTGYAAGTEIKRFLLELEGALPATPRLF